MLLILTWVTNFLTRILYSLPQEIFPYYLHGNCSSKNNLDLALVLLENVHAGLNSISYIARCNSRIWHVYLNITYFKLKNGESCHWQFCHKTICLFLNKLSELICIYCLFKYICTFHSTYCIVITSFLFLSLIPVSHVFHFSSH